MIYVVYNKATKVVVRQGIAAPDECAAQIDNPTTQDVATADNAEALDALKISLGLHD